MSDEKNYPSVEALREMNHKGRFTSAFFAEPGAYQAIRDFSKLNITDEQLDRLKVMHGEIDELCTAAEANTPQKRFTYEDINPYLDGLASIEPDDKGGYMLVFQETMESLLLSQVEGTDLANLTPKKLSSATRDIRDLALSYIYTKMRPGLEQHAAANSLDLYTEAYEQQRYQSVNELRGFLQARTLVPLLLHHEKTYNMIHDFSGMDFTREQFSALVLMYPALAEQSEKLSPADRRKLNYSYRDLNRYMEGIAQIEKLPDGNFELYFPETREFVPLTMAKGLNFEHMSAEQLSGAARVIFDSVLKAIYNKVETELTAYVKQVGPIADAEAELALQEKRKAMIMLADKVVDWPDVMTLENVLEDKSILVFAVSNSGKGHAMVRTLAGITATDAQIKLLQGMLRDLDIEMDELEGKARKKARFSIERLAPYLEGIGTIEITSADKATVRFLELDKPVNITGVSTGDIRNMTEHDLKEAATAIRSAFNDQIYKKIKDPIEHHLALVRPILAEKAEVEKKEREAKYLETLQEILGEDADKVSFVDKFSSGGQEIVSLAHPEFKIFCPCKTPDDFLNKLRSVYPGFKKKITAYEALLTESEKKYGITWKLEKDNITAHSGDFELASAGGQGVSYNSLKDYGKRLPLARCTGDDIMSWMHAAIGRVEHLGKRRLAEYYAFKNSSPLDVEIVADTQREGFRKLVLRNPETQDSLEEPLIGTEGLFGKAARALIKNGPAILLEKAPATQAEPKAETPASESAPQQERKTELVIDNGSLTMLASSRAQNETWLPFVQMAKMTPSVERVAIPSVVAFFEAQGAMPTGVDKDGKILLDVLDPTSHNNSRAKAINGLIARARWVRIRDDGTEEILRDGDPKLVIYESSLQDKFYDEVKFWKKQAEDTGIKMSEQMPFLREDAGKNVGEDAIYDYCQRSSKHKPVIVTDDYNSIYRRQFLASHNKETLCTPEGTGIGFSTARGLVEAVRSSFGDMTLPLFGRFVAKKESRPMDVSVSAVAQSLKANKAPESIQENFSSEFPPFIAGTGRRASQNQPQLHRRIAGNGLGMMIQMGVGSKQTLESGSDTFKKAFPFDFPQRQNAR